MSPASSFIAANRERLHASTPKSYEPTAKRFKSDLTFHCIVCSDVYDDPNVLYEHMKKCHPELYERGSGTENEEDVYSANDDDEINHIDLSESNGFDSDHELSEEELVDLSRLLEPICELRHEGDEDDEVQKRNVQNGNATGNNGMLSSGSIEQAIQMNPLLNQLTNEQQLRLQLQLQMQLQQHLLQLQQVQNLKQAHNQLDVSLKASNGNASRPLALRKFLNTCLCYFELIQTIFHSQLKAREEDVGARHRYRKKKCHQPNLVCSNARSATALLYLLVTWPSTFDRIHRINRINAVSAWKHSRTSAAWTRIFEFIAAKSHINVSCARKRSHSPVVWWCICVRIPQENRINAKSVTKVRFTNN